MTGFGILVGALFLASAIGDLADAVRDAFKNFPKDVNVKKTETVIHCTPAEYAAMKAAEQPTKH